MEAVFTKTVMNNEWNINFLQNSLLGIHFYSSEFFIGWSTSETPFDMIWNFVVFILMCSKS